MMNLKIMSTILSGGTPKNPSLDVPIELIGTCILSVSTFEMLSSLSLRVEAMLTLSLSL